MIEENLGMELYGADTSGFREANIWQLQDIALEENVRWVNIVRNERVVEKIKEKGKLLKYFKESKPNLLRLTLKLNCLTGNIIKLEVTRRWGRQSVIVIDIKEEGLCEGLKRDEWNKEKWMWLFSLDLSQDRRQ